MICDVIERINIKKVDKCMDSDKHLDTRLIGLPYHVERLLCHTTHIRGPQYNHAFYITDMICEMLLHPSRAKSLWSEMMYTLKKGRSYNA